MPQHKSAIKRVRQNKKRKDRNKNKRSKLKTLIRGVLTETDKKAAEEKLKAAVSYIDKASNKGIIHPNNGARKKAQLTTHVNKL
jgi:small subunit ribosomal protein S20